MMRAALAFMTLLSACAAGPPTIWPETNGICGKGCKAYHPPAYNTGDLKLDRALQKQWVEHKQRAEQSGLKHLDLIGADDRNGGLY